MSTPGLGGGDLHQIAVLLEALRGMGSGRVLDEVLALVLDSAIEVTGAERGFLMLANDEGVLEMKLARAEGQITLPLTGFTTSRKIPEEVFATGKEKSSPICSTTRWTIPSSLFCTSAATSTSRAPITILRKRSMRALSKPDALYQLK